MTLDQDCFCTPLPALAVNVMPRCCRFVSDLHHLLSPIRGRSLRIGNPASGQRDGCSSVGCGDIFDFKWSTLASQNETIREACLWLINLASLNLRCEVQYVLGNHDFNDPFMEALDDFAEDCPIFIGIAITSYLAKPCSCMEM